MLAPSAGGEGSASNTARGQVTGTEMSASESRRVRKTFPTPARRLTWASWPSTHTAPRRSIQPATACAIWRTGAGDCAEVSRATGGSLDSVDVTTTDLGIPRIADSSVLLA